MDLLKDFYNYISTQTKESAFEVLDHDGTDGKTVTLKYALIDLFNFVQTVAPNGRYFSVSETYTATANNASDNSIQLNSNVHSVDFVYINDQALNNTTSVNVGEGQYKMVGNKLIFNSLSVDTEVIVESNNIPTYSVPDTITDTLAENVSLNTVVTPAIPANCFKLLALFYVNDVVNSKTSMYSEEEKRGASFKLENEKRNLSAILKNRVNHSSIPNNRRVITDI